FMASCPFVVLIVVFFFSFLLFCAHRYLHSFPTRRSSDLYFWPESFRVNDLALGLKERGHAVAVLTGLPNYPTGRFFPGYGFFTPDRKSTRLNSSHVSISYAVFCLKKKKTNISVHHT